jgi:hypothetical protein
LEAIYDFIGAMTCLPVGLFFIVYLGWMNAWQVQKNTGKFLLALFIGGGFIYFFFTIFDEDRKQVEI